MAEHTVKVSAQDTAKLRDWLTHPNGAFTLGRVTFESVEDGGILVRTNGHPGWMEPDRRL
ncbi:hypothetical protein ACWDBD_21535 [Streptomyces sp. NPDC001118]